MRDGWFATGDVATRAEDGYIRIVGRRATDLIKSGGYKIGAGEIENALQRAPRGRRVGGHRRARRRPRRADHRVDRGRGRARPPGRAGAGRPRRRGCSRRTSARARCATSTRSRATRWARSPRRRWELNRSRAPSSGRPPGGECRGGAPFIIATVVALVAHRGERSASPRCTCTPTSAAPATRPLIDRRGRRQPRRRARVRGQRASAACRSPSRPS